jgi:hypothetical protein
LINFWQKKSQEPWKPHPYKRDGVLDDGISIDFEEGTRGNYQFTSRLFHTGGSATLDIRNGGLGKIEYGYVIWNGTNLQHTAVQGIWKAPRQYSELRSGRTQLKPNRHYCLTAEILPLTEQIKLSVNLSIFDNEGVYLKDEKLLDIFTLEDGDECQRTSQNDKKQKCIPFKDHEGKFIKSSVKLGRYYAEQEFVELKLSIQKFTVLAVDNIKLEDCSTDQRSVSDQLVRGSVHNQMPTPTNTFQTPRISNLANKNSESVSQKNHVITTKVPTTFSTRIVTTSSKLELLKTEKQETETTTAAPITVFNLTNSSIVELDPVQMNSTGNNSTANPNDFYQQTTVPDYAFLPEIDLQDLLLDTDNTQNDDVNANYEFGESENSKEVQPNWEIVEILENTIKLKSRKNHRTYNSVSSTAASLTVIVSALFILINL